MILLPALALLALAAHSQSTSLCNDKDCSLFPADRTFIECLQNAQLEPLTQTDPDFLNATRTWNRVTEHKRPQAYVRPPTAELVGSAVACAARFGVTVTPKSGGHSYTGASAGQDDGLIIDLSLLRDIKLVDKDQNEVFLGVGNRVGRVIYQLYKQFKLAVPIGTCQAVGLGGFLLGGGQGVFSREHGFFSDRIVEYEAVRADGKVVKINAMEQPDLFVKLQGSGGSQLVIVTGVRVKAFVPAEKYTAVIYVGELESLVSVLSAYSAFAEIADERLGAFLAVAPSGISNTFVSSLGANETTALLATYAAATATTLVPGVMFEGNILETYYNYSSTYFTLKNIEELDYAADFDPLPVYGHIKSDVVAHGVVPDVTSLNKLLELIRPLAESADTGSGTQALEEIDTNVAVTNVLNVEFSGGQMNNLLRQSVIPARNSKLIVEFYIQNPDPLTDSQKTWLREMWNAYEPIRGPLSYVNLLDADLVDQPERYWALYLPYLIANKPYYDPLNRFDQDFSFARYPAATREE